MAKRANGNGGTADAGEIAEGLAVKTLTGDLRDFILGRLRDEHDARPWNRRSEAEQRETIRRVEDAVRTTMEHAVELIASRGHRAIPATVASIAVKDGFKAVLEMSKYSELRHQFVDTQGSSVLVVIADIDEFTGERRPAVVTPDQAPLPMAVHADTDQPLH